MTTQEQLAPPVCNTGASDPTELLRWDWYQATLTGIDDPTTVLTVLGFIAPEAVWESARGLYGYATSWDLTGLPTGSLKVFADGTEGVHVQASGAIAHRVVPLIRRHWPVHTVSRADIAFDVIELGSFDRLYTRVHDLARSNPRGKVSTSTAGDWLDRESGRTFYAGGTSSRVRVVVYEKNLEQLAKDPGCGAPDGWTRVEWRLRPSSDQKAWLSTATLSDALGLSAFGARVADELIGSDVVPVGNLLRFASQDPAYWMARQYRRVLLGLLELPPIDLHRRLTELVATEPR